MLLQRRRHELAERELRQELAADPENARAHAFLALCLAERESYAAATKEAQAAIHLAPDMAFAHYALARILHERNRWEEARPAIREAIRLDPEDADYFALWSAIELSEGELTMALRAAEQGLRLDPEHVGCNNLRAMVLVRLGRKEQAGATIATALARDPENELSHANQGWTLLHRGQHQKALEHFREALRLDPHLDWARTGIVEALKARHFVYSVLLRYFLWMSNLSQQGQCFVILSAVLVYKLLEALADHNPTLAPWIRPILIAYILFAISTWLASPLFDLLLRLDRFGRHALSRDQLVASNWLAGLLGLALLCLILWLLTGHPLGLAGAIYFGLLSVPVVAIFKCAPGWPRWLMALYTVVLACVPWSALFTGDGGGAGRAFLISVFLSAFVATGLAMVVPRR